MWHSTKTSIWCIDFIKWQTQVWLRYALCLVLKASIVIHGLEFGRVVSDFAVPLIQIAVHVVKAFEHGEIVSDSVVIGGQLRQLILLINDMDV